MTGNLRMIPIMGDPSGGNLDKSPTTCGQNVRFTQKHNPRYPIMVYNLIEEKYGWKKGKKESIGLRQGASKCFGKKT
jgi:hypothetical protein